MIFFFLSSRFIIEAGTTFQSGVLFLERRRLYFFVSFSKRLISLSFLIIALKYPSISFLRPDANVYARLSLMISRLSILSPTSFASDLYAA